MASLGNDDRDATVPAAAIARQVVRRGADMLVANPNCVVANVITATPVLSGQGWQHNWEFAIDTTLMQIPPIVSHGLTGCGAGLQPCDRSQS